MKGEKNRLKDFFSYFKGKKGSVWLVLVAAVGIILMLLGSFGGRESSSVDERGESEKIEERLEEICSQLEGVGECRVIVNYVKNSAGYGSSGIGRVESVAVLCRGGGSEKVKKELTELITSLYGIGANRVKIGKLE